MLAGQTEIHGGELAFQKGTRVALHDQRPPLELGLTLREYAFSGAGDVIAAEEELARLEQAMAGGDAGRRRCAATARHRRCSSTRADTPGASARIALLRGLGFADDDLDRELTHVLRRRADARLARARARRGPDLLLLDEPTNHLDVERLEWLERELQTMDAAVILVAHDRWFLEAVTTSVLELEAGRSHVFTGHVAHLAPREGGARPPRREGGRPDRRRHRPARALRRAVPLQEVEGEAGAGEAHADRAPQEGALDAHAASSSGSRASSAASASSS